MQFDLLATGTPLAPTRTAADGFAALATLDANHDGKIDAQDPDFAQLQVWVDGNTHPLADVWLAVDHSSFKSHVTSLVWLPHQATIWWQPCSGLMPMAAT